MWFATDAGCLGVKPYEPSRIERMANLTLPPSAENLFAHSNAIRDCFVFVTFEMAVHDLAQFLASTDVSELEQLRGSQLVQFKNLQGNDVDWTFADNTVYLYGESAPNQSQESQHIVVDQSNSDRYIVYVIRWLG
jgi:hypothetical protein